jgi:OOP family OmpA-OmpF porin
MFKKQLIFFAVLSGMVVNSFAAGDNFSAPPVTFNPGIYLGLSAGYGMTYWDNLDGSNVVHDGILDTYKVSGENNFAGRVYAGYDFHPNFALEVGYTQFFNDTDVDFVSTGQQAFNPNYDWAIDLVAKIKAHIVDNFGLYAKIGVDYLYVTEGVDGQNQNSVNVVFGAGAYYDFTQHFSVDASWMRFNGIPKINQDDYIPYHDLFSAGFAYKFDLA